MKIYKLEVMACGSYWVLNLSDMSGCSDEQRECWQEAEFTVAAESVEEAVKMIEKEYDRLNSDYSMLSETIRYNPRPISVEEDEGGYAEILDYVFHEPKEGNYAIDASEKYSKEV